MTTGEYQSVLVTGGCGFIGSNLVPKLVARGMDVTILDNLSRSNPRRSHIDEVPVVEADITNAADIAEAFEDHDAVIHLAAYGSVVESVESPAANFFNNVTGTFNVLEAARRGSVRKLVFASTGGALIGDATLPVDEESLPKPISPYGAGKLCGEAYSHAFAKAYGLSTVSCRFANVYGPYSEHKKGAITAFIRAIQTGQPIHIFGDGTATRDFLHVDDLCNGIIGSLETELQPGTVLHLASGVETSVADLATMITRAFGLPDHPVDFKPRRRAEVERNFAEYERAREVLGFEPAWSLEAGIESTVRWFQGLDA